MTPNGHADTQYAQPLQTSGCTITVPNSVLTSAPVGQTSRQPACAKACPTNSIQFGELSELRERAEHRLAHLQSSGQRSAHLYLADEDDGVGGAGAFFLLLDEPEVYGLPPDPVDTRRDLGTIWAAAGAAALALGAGLAAAVWGGER